MKKTGTIISYLSALVIFLFSLFFLVIEARNLMSGDWLLYENQMNGFIRYFFRFLLSLFSLSISFSTFFILRKKNGNPLLLLYFRFGVFSLFISCIILAIFSSNYIDLLLFILPGIYFLGVNLFFLGEKKAKTTKEETNESEN